MTGEYRLYRELAGWWPLISPPEEYAEEAAYLLFVPNMPPRTRGGEYVRTQTGMG